MVETSLRDQLAKSILIVHKQLGFQGTYKCRGAAGVTIWMDHPKEERDSLRAMSMDIEATSRKVEIARQTNFPPSGMSTGDVITISSVDYEVEDWEVDGVGALYNVSLKRLQPRRLGGK